MLPCSSRDPCCPTPWAHYDLGHVLGLQYECDHLICCSPNHKCWSVSYLQASFLKIATDYTRLVVTWDQRRSWYLEAVCCWSLFGSIFTCEFRIFRANCSANKCPQSWNKEPYHSWDRWALCFKTSKTEVAWYDLNLWAQARRILTQRGSFPNYNEGECWPENWRWNGHHNLISLSVVNNYKVQYSLERVSVGEASRRRSYECIGLLRDRKKKERKRSVWKHANGVTWSRIIRESLSRNTANT